MIFLMKYGHTMLVVYVNKKLGQKTEAHMILTNLSKYDNFILNQVILCLIFFF